ncbi:MAG: hypothetical protein PHR16_10505 [Methylovulum sp.]|nr:hypothetical protein [Methylovulum sp.]
MKHLFAKHNGTNHYAKQANKSHFSCGIMLAYGQSPDWLDNLH